MSEPTPPARVRRRIAAEGRPSTDDGCAGCPQLVPLRALRRAGLAIQGGLGCDPDAPPRFVPAPGQWAALIAGDRLAREGARPLLEAAVAAGAALVVVADDAPARAWFLDELLAGVAARVRRAETNDVGAWDELVAGALAAGPRTVLVSIQRCPRGMAHSPAVTVTASRCNRCGACLSLGCPAVSDPGGEVMWIDPALCAGCRICLPLCRAGALTVAQD